MLFGLFPKLFYVMTLSNVFVKRIHCVELAHSSSSHLEWTYISDKRIRYVEQSSLSSFTLRMNLKSIKHKDQED